MHRPVCMNTARADESEGEHASKSVCAVMATISEGRCCECVHDVFGTQMIMIHRVGCRCVHDNAGMVGTLGAHGDRGKWVMHVQRIWKARDGRYARCTWRQRQVGYARATHLEGEGYVGWVAREHAHAAGHKGWDRRIADART